jgi:hypothetical protein
MGVLESVKAVDGGVQVSGWALDPDTVGPATIHLYVDSVGTALAANLERADLAAHFPAYGTKHGFSTKLPATPGQHTVCAYGINVGGGSNVHLGCQTVVVPGTQMPELGRAPIGVFEAVTVSGSTAVASGWAIDPDTASSIKVHLYVGSKGTEYTADAPRADVARVYPAYGDKHGFVQQLTLPPGKSDVCAYAINTAAGGHTFLGCRTAEVIVQAPDRGRAPIGNFEAAAAAAGGATVSGWALDPDTTQPISVHIYVDSTSAAYIADKPRADVAAAYGLGDRHGFSEFIPMSSGAHTVCVYPINTGPGGNAWLGCRTITVP